MTKMPSGFAAFAVYHGDKPQPTLVRSHRKTKINLGSVPPSLSVGAPSRSLLPSTPTTLFSNAPFVVDVPVAATAAAAVEYGPVLPPTETLLGMGAIILLSAVACWVWANQVVPVSRSNLAISKSRGPVKEYLDELKKSAGEGVLAATTAAEENSQEKSLSYNTGMENGTLADDLLLLSSSPPAMTAPQNEPQSTATPSSSRALERWLFTDWLVDNKSAKKSGGRQKEPALPILKKAKWNSGDNPVLVASALIGIGVLISSITERVVSLV